MNATTTSTIAEAVFLIDGGLAMLPLSREKTTWVRTGYANAELRTKVTRELENLHRLPENWDGYGSPKINVATINAAKRLIGALAEKSEFATPVVVPVPGGRLQFEWHRGERSLELEFETPTTIHFLKWHPEEGIEEEGTYDGSDVERSIQLIKWFMGEIVRV